MSTRFNATDARAVANILGCSLARLGGALADEAERLRSVLSDQGFAAFYAVRHALAEAMTRVAVADAVLSSRSYFRFYSRYGAAAVDRLVGLIESAAAHLDVGLASATAEPNVRGDARVGRREQRH